MLREMGADVSARNGQGFTPAIVAANAGHAMTVRWLHAVAGVAVGAASKPLGWTGAHHAAQNGHLRVLPGALGEGGRRRCRRPRRSRV